MPARTAEGRKVCKSKCIRRRQDAEFCCPRGFCGLHQAAPPLAGTLPRLAGTLRLLKRRVPCETSAVASAQAPPAATRARPCYSAGGDRRPLVQIPLLGNSKLRPLSVRHPGDRWLWDADLGRALRRVRRVPARARGDARHTRAGSVRAEDAGRISRPTHGALPVFSGLGFGMAGKGWGSEPEFVWAAEETRLPLAAGCPRGTSSGHPAGRRRLRQAGPVLALAGSRRGSGGVLLRMCGCWGRGGGSWPHLSLWAPPSVCRRPCAPGSVFFAGVSPISKASPLRPLPGLRRTLLPEHDPVYEGHVAIGHGAGLGPDTRPPAPWPFLLLATGDTCSRPLNAPAREHSGQIDSVCKEEVAELGHT